MALYSWFCCGDSWRHLGYENVEKILYRACAHDVHARRQTQQTHSRPQGSSLARMYRGDKSASSGEKNTDRPYKANFLEAGLEQPKSQQSCTEQIIMGSLKCIFHSQKVKKIADGKKGFTF